jgi:hypothetical protein
MLVRGGEIVSGTPRMGNSVDIDSVHSRAIAPEIGERLRAVLGADPEMSPRIHDQMRRLRELDEPPSKA